MTVILDAALDTERAWQPASFAERGVSIPFTTPALTGARARRGARGLEAIVPQPAGAKGVYILAWGGLADYATLTVHDLKLAELVAAGTATHPPAIRKVAAEAAAMGLAGRSARSAVEAAGKLTERSRLAMNELLLERLVEQMKGATGTAANLDLRAKPCLNALAARVGRPAGSLLDALRVIVELCVDHRFIESGPAQESARISSVASLLAALQELAIQLRREGMADAAASAVLVAARRAEAMASEAAKSARSALSDVAGLLAGWPGTQPGLSATIARPDWLLDGWQQMVLIWQLAAAGPAQQAAIVEMAMVIPPVPRETSGWPGNTGDDAAWARARRQVAAQAAALKQAAGFDILARNEKLRALAA